MKRVEYKQQIIGADGRVLGKQGEECQNTSRHSGGEEQDEVNSPKRLSPAYAVDGGGCGQYEQEQGGLHGGEIVEGLFGFSASGCYNLLLVEHQWARLSFVVCNSGPVEVLLYIERDKHHQSAVDGFVSLAAHT